MQSYTCHVLSILFYSAIAFSSLPPTCTSSPCSYNHFSFLLLFSFPLFFSTSSSYLSPFSLFFSCSVAVNRVATYKELDSELQKHAGIFTLVQTHVYPHVYFTSLPISFHCQDGNKDLKLLAKVLSPEIDIREVSV